MKDMQDSPFDFYTRNSLASRKTELAQLEPPIQESNLHVETLQRKIDRLSEDLKSKDETIIQLSSTLSAIENSVTWAVIARFYALINRLIPPRTLRRHFYDLGVIALRILVHEGPRSLWMRGMTRMADKFPIKSVNTTHPVFRVPLGMNDERILLTLDTPLAARFVSPANRIHAIEVLAKMGEKHNANLRLSLREGSLAGPVIREAVGKGTRVVNNGHIRWNFKPIPNSKGKTYYFQLVSIESPPIAIWYDPTSTPEEFQLFRDEKEIYGRIGFQCFTEETIRGSYNLWVLQNDPSKSRLVQMREECENFPYQPKISIVMPVWNTDERWLRRAIESVFEQTYGNWELCIADGGSTKEIVGRVLKEYAERDPRVCVKHLAENKGIAGNSDEALSLATGEYIGLLDHDDELAPFALYEVVKLLNQDKDVSFVYSDEDKIDDKGRRSIPFFKPDWSPDMFLSHNYLCHFSVIRREIVQRVGGFREGYDGSQDYDLFLRVTETLDEREIAHIPKILYHWRMIPGSAADTIEAKPYAIVAAKLALADAMRRRGIEASVMDGLFFGSYRVQYNIVGNPKISIIIPTKDKVNVLKTCIESVLKRTRYQNYEIIIVDNQSQEQKTFDYYKKLETDPRIRILTYDKPFNFSAMNNFAVSHAEGEHLVLLHNDIEVRSEEWLSAMLEHSQRRGVGAVGAKLLYPNNTVQHAGIILGIIGNPPVGGHAHRHLPASHPGYFGRASHIANVSAATAACLMIPKQVFGEVGGFDESLAVAFNDVDLCLKIRERGYLIVYTPYAKLYHHESLSRGYEDTPEKKARFTREVRYIRERWGKVIDSGDPYYNLNLTREKEDFSVNI